MSFTLCMRLSLSVYVCCVSGCDAGSSMSASVRAFVVVCTSNHTQAMYLSNHVQRTLCGWSTLSARSMHRSFYGIIWLVLLKCMFCDSRFCCAVVLLCVGLVLPCLCLSCSHMSLSPCLCLFGCCLVAFCLVLPAIVSSSPMSSLCCYCCCCAVLSSSRSRRPDLSR